MEIIEIVRERAGLTRIELAEHLGVSRQALERAMKAGKGLTMASLLKLKKLSGLSGGDFFNLLEQERWVERRKPRKRKR